MAALPLRAPAPAAVAAASRISRPFHGAMNVHPLGRRGPLSAPVKLQARTRGSFRSHCDKRADRLHEPDPELENHDPDKAATLKNDPLVEELLNLRAAMGVRVPPDMFAKEKEQISNYMTKLSCSSDSRNLDERVVAEIVCSRVREALDLASEVIDIAAHDGHGTIEFSHHTTDQMVRRYATILCNVADGAYHKKIGTQTALSFFGALRGFGAICHISVRDTVAELKGVHLKNKITHYMDTHSQEFYKKVNNLEDEVARINKEQKLQQMVTTMLLYGLHHTSFYIFRLIECRKLALGYLTSKE